MEVLAGLEEWNEGTSRLGENEMEALQMPGTL